MKNLSRLFFLSIFIVSIIFSCKKSDEVKPELSLRSYISKSLDKNITKLDSTASGLLYFKEKIPFNTGSFLLKGTTAKLRIISGLYLQAGKAVYFIKNMPDTLEVVAGKGELIEGLDEGILLMQKKSVYRFYVLPSLAYGYDGLGKIPKDAPVIISVELVDFK